MATANSASINQFLTRKQTDSVWGTRAQEKFHHILKDSSERRGKEKVLSSPFQSALGCSPVAKCLENFFNLLKYSQWISLFQKTSQISLEFGLFKWLYNVSYSSYNLLQPTPITVPLPSASIHPECINTS